MALSGGTIAFRLLKSSGLCCCIALCWLSACVQSTPQMPEQLPFYNTATFDAEWISKTDPAYNQIHTIDTFTLTDQTGHAVTKDSLDGHIYVANFFFTICPSICPKMMTNLHALSDSFSGNNKVKMVSFSVMPWVDSVSKLKAYSEGNKIDPNQWKLLTGDKNRIYTLGRQSYFAEKGLGLKKDSSEFLHTESMLLVDTKGRIRGIYNATQKVDIERVCEDIRVLLND